MTSQNPLRLRSGYGLLYCALGLLLPLACYGGVGPPDPTPTPRPALVVRVWVDSPVARMGNVQTVHAKVFDLRGRPVGGVNVIAEVNSLYSRVPLVFPVTDGNGQTSYKDVIPASAAPGTLYEVNVKAFLNTATGEDHTSYTIWP